MLNLELSPWADRRLREEAELRGWTGEQFASMILEAFLRMALNAGTREVPLYLSATREEWLAEFHSWVDGPETRNGPEIPMEALRRENMYEDRGL